jgi:hypothetical protein
VLVMVFSPIDQRLSLLICIVLMITLPEVTNLVAMHFGISVLSESPFH